ncbi:MULTISPECIES: alcohol dehydrogenase catalytic domain-containing protein [Bradyrhizobium]|uniref:Alcohol dehydrogenase catalytic domain-containing protein n=1 Tax=Bradyrhizobium brasilense TaxID=1419277 RepID=A0ABY8JI92_9BRAD|nr:MULTISPECIES: alcohol dehydrogenase catalytic domain-containing protein [Bradyrhizobium]MCP1848873.1 NADPH:quinone reductase-like Zn-dependent oxidoreductase [Bradyrhizobium sp. USDA 4541]WFU65347.1 alcohol dehydrogenase catalytic domain-containing protein [Bradyrhizobium brasilense]
MRAFHVDQFGHLDGLILKETSVPPLGPKDVLVRIRANSLNYRDLLIVSGQGGSFNAASGTRPGLVPVCDGAGDVLAVGKDVTRAKIGDRVAGTFIRRWIGGRIKPEYLGEQRGRDVDGLLRDHAVLDEEEVVRVPDHLSYTESDYQPQLIRVCQPTPVATHENLSGGGLLEGSSL